MQDHLFVFKQTGENLDTPRSPWGIWKGQENLEEIIMVLMNWDNWILVPKKLYQVCEVSLPDWVSPVEWAQNVTQQTALKYYMGYGALEWTKEWFIALNALPGVREYACIQLLKTKSFRSDYRKSLRDQLVEWLNTPVETRTYATPLSEKQWFSLLNSNTVRQEKNLSRDIYNGRVPGIKTRYISTEEAYASLQGLLEAAI